MIFKILLLFVISLPCFSKLSVLTTTTDLKWLVEKIGKEHVKVESLLNGSEDPHFNDALPSFVGKAANAQMFCLIGMQLEIGWVPRVLQRSGNAQIQTGGKGYCEAGRTVKSVLQKPMGRVDRSQGDVHPQGNPHYHLGIKTFIESADTVLNTLITLDTKNAETYLNNFETLKIELKALKEKVLQILVPVKDASFMEYHREFTYFFNEFGLKNLGALEKVPGVPPSAGRLARVSIKAKQNKVNLVIASQTSPKRILKKFNEMSSIPVRPLPISILKHNKGPKDYPELLIHIANEIVKAAKK